MTTNTQTYVDVKAEIARLEKVAKELQKTAHKDGISAVKEIIKNFGLTEKDILSLFKTKGPSKRLGRKMNPKYSDPVTGNTWHGGGRTPKWMTAYEKQGRNRTEFLIDKE